MAVVTIQGQIASGGEDLGPEVARLLKADYVDRVILAEAGKRVGATVAALAEKEQNVPGLGARLGHFFRRALEHSAYTGMGADPLFGTGMETLSMRPYPEAPAGPITRPMALDDQEIFEVISQVIQELASDGNVVILGRGANLVLKDNPTMLHVGVVAPVSVRLQRFMAREKLEREEAERRLAGQERARVAFFERHFKVHPDDPMLYHMMVNPSVLPLNEAASVIVRAAQALGQD